MLSLNGLSDQIRLAADPSKLRRVAFRVIDALQDTEVNGGYQILGTAVALIAMQQSSNVSFDEIVWKAMAMLQPTEGAHTQHLQAVREYAGTELREEAFT